MSKTTETQGTIGLLCSRVESRELRRIRDDAVTIVPYGYGMSMAYVCVCELAHSLIRFHWPWAS